MKKINSSSIITVLLLLGSLVLANAIGIRYFARADLTSSKLYSLSAASKDIVDSIPDKVIVKAYFSQNLPGQFGDIDRYIRDILEDYRAYSHGHLSYEFIDPGTEQALEQEAQSFNIPPMTAQSVADDKIEVVRVYMGLAFIYGDKREVIPTITSIGNMEYEITSLLYRLTNPERPVLGFASTGTQEQSASLQVCYEALGRLYDIRPVALDEPIDTAVFDGVFVVAPRLSFTDWQLFNLDQYIMGGGKVAMFMNAFNANINAQQAQAYNLNVNRLLNAYGLGLGDDILIDVNANMIQVSSNQGFYQTRQPVRFPYFPIITTFNKRNIMTRDLQQVPMFYPSSVDTTRAAGLGYDVEGLLYTSQASGRRMGAYMMLNPMARYTQEDFTEKNIPVAAVVRGTFSSAFAASGPPQQPGANPGELTAYAGPFVQKADAENRLLVVGDGNIALDEYVRSVADLLFVQNAADWLLQSDDLISIRSKQIPVRPLREMPAFIRSMVKWINRIGPVILVIILGIVLWQVRRIRNNALMAR